MITNSFKKINNAIFRPRPFLAQNKIKNVAVLVYNMRDDFAIKQGNYAIYCLTYTTKIVTVLGKTVFTIFPFMDPILFLFLSRLRIEVSKIIQ